MISKSALAVTAAIVQLAAASPVAAQEDVAAFFKDKQLKLVVGSAAGDGYDVNARVLIRHWVNPIPGKPQIIIQAFQVPSWNSNTSPPRTRPHG